MAEDVKALARRYYDEIWNKGNLSLIDTFCGSDYRGSEPLSGSTSSREELKQIIQGYRTAFPDLVMKPEQFVSEGDTVVVRWTGTGTHRGEIMGMPPTGTKASVTGIDILRFSNGKLVEDVSQFDVLKMMQSIGALPAGAGVAAKAGAKPEARH